MNKYMIKSIFIEDVDNLFNTLKNIPELDKRQEYFEEYLSKASSYVKRLLSVYIKRLISSDRKRVLFFQPFMKNNQLKNIEISLVDLKVSSEHHKYYAELFPILEDFMSKLPESVFNYCKAYYSKINLLGLPIPYLKEIFKQYKLYEYDIKLEEVLDKHFNITEEIKIQETGLLNIPKFPVILTTLKSKLLYYFKDKKSIITNVEDDIILNKLDVMFETIYLLGTFENNSFNLIYLDTIPLKQSDKVFKGKLLDKTLFKKELLEKFAICFDYNFAEFYKVRNLKQLLSYMWRFKNTTLLIRPNIIETYQSSKFLRRYRVSFIHEDYVIFKEDITKEKLLISEHNILNNDEINIYDFKQDYLYLIFKNGKDKYNIYDKNMVNKSRRFIGNIKNPRIKGEIYDVFI